MYVKNFFEAEFENRDECVCWFVMPRGAVGRLSAGCVVVQPGGTFTSYGHTGWRQVYFVVEGTGTMKVGRRRPFTVGPNTVVEIPYDEVHTITADLAGPVKYIYVNDDSQPVLKAPERPTRSAKAKAPAKRRPGK